MDRQDHIDMKAFSIKNKQGFTLVEFLIATVILGVGLLALINLQLGAIRGNSDSKEMTLLDKMYWGYKCHRPVLHPEPGPYDLTYFDDNNKKNISLPSGFQKKSSFTLGAVGDLIRTDALENSKDILYEKVHSFIFDKDISFANLESQLTTQPVKEEIFSDKGAFTVRKIDTSFAAASKNSPSRPW